MQARTEAEDRTVTVTYRLRPGDQALLDALAEPLTPALPAVAHRTLPALAGRGREHGHPVRAGPPQAAVCRRKLPNGSKRGINKAKNRELVTRGPLGRSTIKRKAICRAV